MTHTQLNYPTHYPPETYERWRGSLAHRMGLRTWIQTDPAAAKQARIILAVGGFVHPDWTPDKIAEQIDHYALLGEQFDRLIATMGDDYDQTAHGHVAFHAVNDPIDGLAPLCVRCWL